MCRCYIFGQQQRKLTGTVAQHVYIVEGYEMQRDMSHAPITSLRSMQSQREEIDEDDRVNLTRCIGLSRPESPVVPSYGYNCLLFPQPRPRMAIVDVSACFCHCKDSRNQRIL